MANVLIDSRRMFARFKKLDETATRRIKEEVRDTTKDLHGDAQNAISKPVTKGRGGRTVRSRPGQPARRETGRFWRALKWKTSPKGWVGYLTTTNVASDKKGNRYPWMLESGTKYIKKRPLFRMLKRRKAREYRRRIGRVMIDCIRGAS
jgi:hypothetical protein